MLTNLMTNAHLYTDEGGRLTVSARRRRRRASCASSLRQRARHDAGTARARLRPLLPRRRARRQRRHRPRPRDRQVARRPARRLDRRRLRARRGHEFTVPLPARARPPAPSPPARRCAAGASWSSTTSPRSRQLIGEQLSPSVSRPRSVHAARRRSSGCAPSSFDAMTLDILMPGISGFEVLRELRGDPCCAACRSSSSRSSPAGGAARGEWAVTKPIDADGACRRAGLGDHGRPRRASWSSAGPSARPTCAGRSTSSPSSTSGPPTPPEAARLCASTASRSRWSTRACPTSRPRWRRWTCAAAACAARSSSFAAGDGAPGFAPAGRRAGADRGRGRCGAGAARSRTRAADGRLVW